MANTRASAVTEARELKRSLLRAGVPQVSIEVIPGRPSVYGVWNAQFVVCSFAHHTVSRYSSSNRTPCLSPGSSPWATPTTPARVARRCCRPG
jgi:hypothetical protein